MAKGQRRIRVRSEATVRGWPLVAVAFGADPPTGEREGHAKGIIAIGDSAEGVLALGGNAVGLVALGGAALGLVSSGGASVGYLAAGRRAWGKRAFSR